MRDEFKSYCFEGAHPSIVINERDNMTKKQFIQVLERVRKSVETKPLQFFDDDTPGFKDMGCNWGLCWDTREFYPNPELHTFPQDFVDRGRCTAIEPPEGFDCPMRERRDDGNNESGCFHQCRVFQKNRKTPSRAEALKLIDATIIEASK